MGVILLTLISVQYNFNTQPIQASGASVLVTTPTSEHEHAEDAATDTAVAQEQIFQITVATYLMDNAGFHAIDERINQEGVIEAGDAGVVNRVSRLLAVTAWPEKLQAQVDPLRESLTAYAEALANDDVEAAKPLATQVHDLEHDLSHAVAQWVDSVSGVEGEHSHDDEHEHSQ
jgi:hypothetical protein